jgi:unsaturated chondroitin disaccharide hydrolase
LAGVAHAEMSRAFIRKDNSTYHALEYDLISGEVARAYTFQGYSDRSFWSRGQSWAIRGYAATAAATRTRSYLKLAEALAERFLERLGSMPTPPYDFDDPNSTRPLDSSAAAILASALIDIAELQSSRSERTHWQNQAIKILDNITHECLAREDNHRGVLKHGCYSWPHREGIDSAVLFGDYFYIEAICKLIMPGALTPALEPIR